VKDILIILDNEDIIKTIKTYLNNGDDFSFTIVSNSDKALQYLDEKSPHLVISDLNLLKIDGLQLTKMIRAGEVGKNRLIPIILISLTYIDGSAALMAEEAEANAFFYYPFSKDIFMKTVLSLLEPAKFAGEEAVLPSFKRKILIADDDVPVAKLFEVALKKENYDVFIAKDGEEAIQMIEKVQPHLVLLDYMMPKVNGMEVLKWVKNTYPDVIVIIVTAHGSEILAVDLMKEGADDYLKKPVNVKNLSKICENSLKRLNIKKLAGQFQEKYREIDVLKREIQEQYSFNNIIGKNYKMRMVYNLIEQIADTTATVLIQGDTGTGKELVAKAIHYNSPRRNKPFIAVNCAALPETLLESELFGHERGAFTGAVERRAGRFERADGSTLFLDEITEISPSIQAKLLRVLQEKEFERVGGNQVLKVDVRILASTNKNIEAYVRSGDFREDLYFRLNVVKIAIPPLRDRIDDIPMLAMHFLKKFNKKFSKDIKKFSRNVLYKMMEYSWPGNVRELENVIERAVLLSSGSEIHEIQLPDSEDDLQDCDFSTFIKSGKPFQDVKKTVVDQFEKEYIMYVLRKFNGNIKLSSEYAQLERSYFSKKMKEYGLNKEDFK